MQVILIRHADAVDESLELRDPHRHLTPRGRAQAAALGDRLRWHDCTPTVVWTSPLVRATQTAELVLGQYEPDVRAACVVEAKMALAPNAEVGEKAFVAAIAALPAGASVYVVGHEPSLSAIGGLILKDPAFGALSKAQAARIVDGKLRWRFSCDAEAPELEAK